MTAVITKEGLIKIPRELQEQLGFRPGNVLELKTQAGTLVVWKRADPGVFERWRGRSLLPAGTDTDDLLRLMRDGNGG